MFESVCVTRMCECIHVWGSKYNFQELFLSSHLEKQGLSCLCHSPHSRVAGMELPGDLFANLVFEMLGLKIQATEMWLLRDGAQAARTTSSPVRRRLFLDDNIFVF